MKLRADSSSNGFVSIRFVGSSNFPQRDSDRLKFGFQLIFNHLGAFASTNGGGRKRREIPFGCLSISRSGFEKLMEI